MSVSSEDRFAPPQAMVADVPAAESGDVLASRGVRFVAAIIDAAILWLILMVVSFVVPAIKEVLAQRGANFSMTSLNLSSLFLGFTVFLLVQAWPLLKRGQTVAKMLFKIRIVRTDGSKPDAWRLLGLRYGIGFLLNVNVITSMIYALLDCLLIFRESRQCLHDTIADTKVIKL
ncbi:RDD family protein [Roseateles chitinivorans]|uniref:RDD family protein n=1 Tax=Roseateles chitinivorans TaxID=2917965 RepID=UPI003D67B216